MDVGEFLKKAYILGGHCSDCNGFLFTEVLTKRPFRVQQRCLRCGKVKTIDIDDGYSEKTRTGNLYYSSASKYPIFIEDVDPASLYDRSREYD